MIWKSHRCLQERTCDLFCSVSSFSSDHPRTLSTEDASKWDLTNWRMYCILLSFSKTCDKKDALNLTEDHTVRSLALLFPNRDLPWIRGHKSQDCTALLLSFPQPESYLRKMPQVLRLYCSLALLSQTQTYPERDASNLETLCTDLLLSFPQDAPSPKTVLLYCFPSSKQIPITDDPDKDVQILGLYCSLDHHSPNRNPTISRMILKKMPEFSKLYCSLTLLPTTGILHEKDASNLKTVLISCSRPPTPIMMVINTEVDHFIVETPSLC